MAEFQHWLGVLAWCAGLVVRLHTSPPWLAGVQLSWARWRVHFAALIRAVYRSACCSTMADRWHGKLGSVLRRVSFFGFYSFDGPSFDSQLSSLGTFLRRSFETSCGCFKLHLLASVPLEGLFSVLSASPFATLISVASGFAVVSHVLDGAAVAHVRFGLRIAQRVP